jgi:hypothetical protein
MDKIVKSFLDECSIKLADEICVQKPGDYNVTFQGIAENGKKAHYWLCIKEDFRVCGFEKERERNYGYYQSFKMLEDKAVESKLVDKCRTMEKFLKVGKLKFAETNKSKAEKEYMVMFMGATGYYIFYYNFNLSLIGIGFRQ